MNKIIKISIVIPVKNGSTTIADCLNAIRNQTIYKECEIIIIDSGSTDGTLEFLKQYDDVKVISIDPKTFNHGATRNLGVQHAQGEFVVMTVQDAVAADNYWLEKMLRHFEDNEVAGVCGQQIVPHDLDKNPHEWFRPQSEPEVKSVQFKDINSFYKLSAAEKRSICGWDDVNAMYRKERLKEIPFESFIFGEDMFWAKTALEKAYKLVYDHSARVNHYHFQFPEYTYRRVLISKVFIYKSLGYSGVQTYAIKDYLLVIYRNFKWKCHLKWMWHNFNIIYYHRKATRAFLKAVRNNKIKDLEQKFALNIPIGKQNNN